MVTNMNTESGIRYGVVTMNSLQDWVFEEFLNNGENVSYQEAEKEFIAEFLFEYEGDKLQTDLDEALDMFRDSYHGEEERYTLISEGMSLELSYLGGAPLVWVLSSPVVERARLCSPCCPNAGDLDNKDEGGYETYSLPSEWFAQ